MSDLRASSRGAEMASSDVLKFRLFEWRPFWSSAEAVGDPSRIGRRVAVAVLVTWVALVVLSLLQGQAIGPTTRESFLLDLAMYARFLIALPLLIAAPAMIDARVERIVQQFVSAGVIRERERGNFNANIEWALKSRDSWSATISLMIAAYLYSAAYILIYSQYEFIAPSSWHTVGVGDERVFSFAGWWYVLVSLPIFLYFVLDFLYRMFLWWQFLKRTARLDLKLRPFHADQSAGLGFLHIVLNTLWLPVFAICVSVAGSLGTLVLWFDVRVAEYRIAVLLFVIILVAIVNLPLTAFSAKILAARRQSILEDGVLASIQIDQFEDKWSSSSETLKLDMLDSPDFSSLIDLNSAVAGAHKTKTLIRVSEMARLAFLLFIPFVLVAALELPMKDILARLVELLV